MPWVEDEQSGSHYEQPRKKVKQDPLPGFQGFNISGEHLRPPRSEKQLANDERLREMAKQRREGK